MMSGSTPVKSSVGGALQVRWIANSLGSEYPLKLVGGGSKPATNQNKNNDLLPYKLLHL